MVRHLLAAVDASKLTDCAILDAAGLDKATLHRLRSGQKSLRIGTFVALAEVVGMRVTLERAN